MLLAALYAQYHLPLNQRVRSPVVVSHPVKARNCR
jgi:hypothetical protein